MQRRFGVFGVVMGCGWTVQETQALRSRTRGAVRGYNRSATAGAMWLIAALGLIAIPPTARAADGPGDDVPIGRHGGAGIPQARAVSETVREPSTFGVNLEAWATLPLGVGGGITLEGPAGFRAGFGAGATPDAFIDLGIAAVGQPGSYSTDAAIAIRDRLETPMFLRVSFAIAPPSWGGFYLGVGYGLYRGAVTVTAGDIHSSLWPAIAGVSAETTASLTVVSHHVTADIGWEFDIGNNFSLRATLGGVFTFESDAELRVTGLAKVVGVEEQQASITAAETSMEEAIVDYGKVPTLTIALTYRLF